MPSSFLRLLFAVLLLPGCFLDDCGGDDEPEDAPINEEGPRPDPTVLGPLTELSSGECPDMSETGISEFDSGGEIRKVGIAFPVDRPEGMPLVIALHGFNLPSNMPVEAWMPLLQAEAESRGIVIAAPEGLVYTLPLNGDYLGWGFLGDPTLDLSLFDDLRTCIAQEFDFDLSRLALLGHSGGALWSSNLMMRRTHTIASIAEFSGGSDFDLPLLNGPFVAYEDPGRDVPVLLVSGGATDVWPNEASPIINFESTSDNLQYHLRADSYTVARCRHQMGHAAWPDDAWQLGMDWATGHVFGEASAFSADTILNWCDMQ